MEAIDSKLYTTEYIENLPNDVRMELINGKLYNMATLSYEHQLLAGEIHFKIRSFIEKNNGTCKVLEAPFGVYLNNDDRTYVKPDVSVICDTSKIDKKGCHGAPDMTIEIVSDSTRMNDYVKKSYKYEESGVKEYWIVDKDKDIITVFNFDKQTIDKYTFKDRVPVGIYA